VDHALLYSPGTSPVSNILASVRSTHISREQRISAERPALAFVVSMKDNQDVLHRNHHHKGPNNDGEDADEIIVRGFGGEGGRIDVEWTGSNVTVDDANTLVCEP
jgi:hypothetical protein